MRQKLLSVVENATCALVDFLRPLTCEHCRSTDSSASMQRHVFMIDKRGRPLSGRKFCSLICLDEHLKYHSPDWQSFAEYLTYTEGHCCMHHISVSEREKSRTTFRYSDATEMKEDRPGPQPTGHE